MILKMELFTKDGQLLVQQTHHVDASLAREVGTTFETPIVEGSSALLSMKTTFEWQDMLRKTRAI